MKKLYLLLPMMMSLCSSQAAWWNPLSWGKNTSSAPYTLSTTHRQNNNISSPLADHAHIKVTSQGDQFITHKALQRIHEENGHTHAAPTPTSAVADVTLSHMFEKQIGQRSEILKPFVKNEEFSSLKSFISRQAQQELNHQPPTNLMTAAHRTLSISNLYFQPYIDAEKKRRHNNAAQVIQRTYKGYTAKKQVESLKKEHKKKLNNLVEQEKTAQQALNMALKSPILARLNQSQIIYPVVPHIDPKTMWEKQHRHVAVQVIQKAWREHQGRQYAKAYKAATIFVKNDIPIRAYLDKQGQKKLTKIPFIKSKQRYEARTLHKNKIMCLTFPNYYSQSHLETLRSINKEKAEQELQEEAQSQALSAYHGAKHCYDIIFSKNQTSPSRLNKHQTSPSRLNKRYNKDNVEIARKHNVEVARNILSYLYTQCYDLREDKQGFHEGTFFVKDNNLTQFFREYYKIAQKGTTIYPRDNSHGFVDSFGIDLPQPFAGKFNTILVSFKSNDEQGVWIKPESAGYSGWSNTVRSAWNTWITRQSQSPDDADIFNKVYIIQENLISSYFMSTQNTRLIGLYHEIVNTKEKISELKRLEKSRKEEQPDDIFTGTAEASQKIKFPETKKQIQQLISYINATKKLISNQEVQEYLTKKSNFFTELLKNTDEEILKELATQQIFDKEYHNNFIAAEEEYKNNKNTIDLNQTIQEHLQEF